jgi:hypothetical protein
MFRPEREYWDSLVRAPTVSLRSARAVTARSGFMQPSSLVDALVSLKLMAAAEDQKLIGCFVVRKLFLWRAEAFLGWRIIDHERIEPMFALVFKRKKIIMTVNKCNYPECNWN